MAPDPVSDSFTTAVIADLDAILVRLDTRDDLGLAAIHIQWAIELLRGSNAEDMQRPEDDPWIETGRTTPNAQPSVR